MDSDSSLRDREERRGKDACLGVRLQKVPQKVELVLQLAHHIHLHSTTDTQHSCHRTALWQQSPIQLPEPRLQAARTLPTAQSWLRSNALLDVLCITDRLYTFILVSPKLLGSAPAAPLPKVRPCGLEVLG